MRTFAVSVWVNRASEPRCADVATADATGETPLASGACTTIPVKLTGVPSGSYTVWFLADSRCQVPESSETNNARSAAYTVSVPDDRFNSDLHASAEYRAHLVTVMAKRAVAQLAA